MISSVYNPLIKHLVKIRENRKYRNQKKSVLICGKTLISEISKIQKPKLLVTTSINSFSIPGAKTIVTTQSILQKITGLETFEDVVGEFELPNEISLKKKQWILALDQVRDPGNLGTLIRSATAFGWDGIFFLPNTADPFNDKAIRASRGALFYTPFYHGTWEDLKEISKTQNIPVYVADIRGQSIDNICASDKVILILGHETQGPSSEALSLGKTLSIPMSGNMESLNVSVAGSILLFFLKNQH